jgi:hypothetical protein
MQTLRLQFCLFPSFGGVPEGRGGYSFGGVPEGRGGYSFGGVPNGQGGLKNENENENEYADGIIRYQGQGLKK